eukprot:gene234-423_t
MPKPKKVKKTKAQIEEERLLAEEEARKAKELEDKRLAEEAERKRLENLRIATERAAFRRDEIGRLTEEYLQMEDDRKGREYQMRAEESSENARLEWLRYKDPSDEPDPSSERDLNTFLAQVSENNFQTLNEVLDLSKKVEYVARSVEAIWADSVAAQNNKMKEIAESYMEKFSDLILEKVDSATAHLLRFSDEQINDRNELQLEDGVDRLFIGLWTSFNEIRPIRKSVHFEKVGVQIDIPKQILQHDAHFIHRVVRVPIETISYKGYHADIGKPGFLFQTDKFVVGDLIMMDILRPPPGAYTIRARKWVIRDKSSQSTHIQKSVYPSSVACRCFFKIPEDIFMNEDTAMAIWNEDTKQWTEEGISDFQYVESTRQAQFYTTAVGIFALVKSRTSDMPYKSWSLCPVRSHEPISDPSSGGKVSANYERHARLVIQTQRIEVVIDIVGTKCKLLEPNCKQTSDLIGVEITPGALLHRLQRRGINLFPTPQDAARCPSLNKPVKNIILENVVLEEIARCSCALDFQSTPWNQSLNHNQMSFYVRETSAFTGNGENFDFETILAEMDNASTSYRNAEAEGILPGQGVKFTNVMGNEYGDKSNHSIKPRPGESTHLSLSMALSKTLMPEALKRIQRTNKTDNKSVPVNRRFCNALFCSFIGVLGLINH